MESFVTMITPYKEDGSVDLQTAEKYVEMYYNAGLSGIFSVCLSSEIFFLSPEERVKLNQTVYKKAKELEKTGTRPFTVVSSGHVADSLEEQARELNEIYKSGTDTLILILNRLDINNEGDDVLIKNAEELISRLPEDAKLGLYECPYPYKRLLTPKILDWVLKTGRFYYIKDTCCDSKMMKERCKQLAGSNLKLFNANCQTLLESMENGAAGYCGVMANFHPRLYAWLCESFGRDREKERLVQSVIGTFGFTEGGLPYPLSAKYSMCLRGIETANVARNRKSEELTDYAKACVEQMKRATDWLEETLI